MSTITTGVGLISGLPIADIVDKLMAIEHQPVDQLNARVQEIQLKQQVFQAFNLQLQQLQSMTADFDSTDLFRASLATSSNEDVLSATAAPDTPVGSYKFQVASLVSSYQGISNGFSDRDDTPVGRGTVTVELGKGRVDPATSLDLLNDQTGVDRGTIEITDRAGHKTTIDLKAALTVRDVLDAINSNIDVDVQAEVHDDHITITDVSEGTGTLRIRDLTGTTTAADLGIAGTSTSGQIVGGPLLRLTEKTALQFLNDRNGVQQGGKGAAGDFILHANGKMYGVNLSGNLRFETNINELNSGQGVRLGKIKITNREGRSAVIDLNDRGDGQPVQSVNDINRLIVNATDENGEKLGVSITAIVGTRLTLVDESVGQDETATSNLIIEDVDGGHAAQDLGIVADTSAATVVGESIYRINTIGDVLRAIQYAPEILLQKQDVTPEATEENPNPEPAFKWQYTYNKVDSRVQYNNGDVGAALADDGRRIELQGDNIRVELANNSQAAVDLGLVDESTVQNDQVTDPDGDLDPFERTTYGTASERIIAGLDTVLLKTLNGGKGVGGGTIQIEAGDGEPGQTGTGTITQVDLTDAETLQDVIDAINATTETSKVRAKVSESGLGLVIEDLSGGANRLTISDVGGGTVAADLQIAGSEFGKLGGGNLQKQYITQATKLSDLNAGSGVPSGSLRIYDGIGLFKSVSVKDTDTIGDVIAKINALQGDGLQIQARINDSGDGILLEDLSDGSNPIKVQEDSNTGTAAALGLLGQAADGDDFLDGSFEIRIAVDSDDSLQDVANKINAAHGQAVASVINDGSVLNGYRLSVLSNVAGTPGELLLDGGQTSLTFSTLAKAHDAVVFFGEGDSPNAIRLVSPTNTITNFIDGLTLNLTGTSNQPVEIGVSRDVESIVSDIRQFVDSFNSIVDRINELTKFDTDTNQRGLLLGDSTTRSIQSRLYSMVTASVPQADPKYNRLSSVGITIGDGAHLQFDADRFRKAYADDPEAVERLFTLEVVETKPGQDPQNVKLGLGHKIQEVLKDITAPATGLIAQETNRLTNRQELFQDRIDSLEKLLDGKRSRLEAQFQAMESTLADMQRQQSALANLTSLISSS